MFRRCDGPEIPTLEADELKRIAPNLLKVEDCPDPMALFLEARGTFPQLTTTIAFHLTPRLSCPDFSSIFVDICRALAPRFAAFVKQHHLEDLKLQVDQFVFLVSTGMSHSTNFHDLSLCRILMRLLLSQPQSCVCFACLNVDAFSLSHLANMVCFLSRRFPAWHLNPSDDLQARFLASQYFLTRQLILLILPDFSLFESDDSRREFLAIQSRQMRQLNLPEAPVSDPRPGGRYNRLTLFAHRNCADICAVYHYKIASSPLGDSRRLRRSLRDECVWFEEWDFGVLQFVEVRFDGFCGLVRGYSLQSDGALPSRWRLFGRIAESGDLKVLQSDVVILSDNQIHEFEVNQSSVLLEGVVLCHLGNAEGGWRSMRLNQLAIRGDVIGERELFDDQVIEKVRIESRPGGWVITGLEEVISTWPEWEQRVQESE
jgi:hypothetical protein